MRPITLGIVPYLNTLPLLEGLDKVFPRSNWVRATPRELAGLLAAGEVDVAQVSVFEGLRLADRYRMVPGAAIGSNGPVRSVALYSKVPTPEIQSVLLDLSSLTSTHLLRILLREIYGIEPKMEDSRRPVPADFPWQNDPHDAFLVIGDVALRWESDFPYKLDLGEAWRLHTGMPFVYAAWWVRDGVALTEAQVTAFRRAREQGEASVEEIVARQPEAIVRAHGGQESLNRYLSESIRFRLGRRELEGLEAFRQKLILYGYIPTEAGEARLVPVGENVSPH